MKTTRVWVCAGMLLTLSGCMDINGGPADLQSLRESRPLGMTKDLSVDVNYGVGNLEVAKIADDNLFSLEVQYDQGAYNPRFSFNDGEHASMRLDMDHRWLSSSTRDEDLVLRLSDKVPIDFKLSTGVSKSRLDMTDLQISRLRMQSGVGKTEILFTRPAATPMDSFEVESGVGDVTVRGLGNTRVRRFKLAGGVGNTVLDFTGEPGTMTMDCRIEAGVGKVRLIFPRDADVELRGEGSFLSKIDAPGFERNGKSYTHRGDSGATIRINVESGIGAVSVELI